MEKEVSCLIFVGLPWHEIILGRQDGGIEGEFSR
jgi:hypothetical protein